MAKKYDKVVIKTSSNPKKKLDAVFSNSTGARTKTVSFGSKNMDDYTKTKDKAQRSRYLARHRRNENWNSPTTAGALSRWILWSETSRSLALSKYKKRFNLK